MGICKFQDIWKTLFSWVLPVPENAHKAKCKYCPGKLIDIKCGSQALKRHEACSIHMKAVTSVAGSTIVAQMQAGTSVEEGKLKVVLLHCLKLVLDGHSLRSSDCCSRSRNFYSKLFPDSKYADNNCGRTKAGYIIQSSLVYSDVTIRHVKDLSQRFNLSPTDVADDYAKLRVKITTEFKLINLFLENELTEFPCISKLVECCSVLCPHNMMVESGFSKMKFFEDNYQANFSVDMYNSFRLVTDNFSRDAFEDFKPTESLLKLAKSASKMYKDEQSSFQEVEKSDNKKHVEVLVFKRKADKALDRELQEAGKELAEAEIAFVQAKKRKQELEAMKSGVIARRDNVSDEIISSMFS